jgi:hypothetical protein
VDALPAGCREGLWHQWFATIPNNGRTPKKMITDNGKDTKLGNASVHGVIVSQTLITWH